MASFMDPFGPGALGLLAVLLVVSTLIGLLHARRISTLEQFLTADRSAKWYDFAASQVGYTIGVATSVVLIPALAYTYGPAIIPISCLSYFISFVVYALFLQNEELNRYLRKRAGLPQFVAGHYSDDTFILYVSTGILAVVYWGFFGVEIVALKGLLVPIAVNASVVPILVLVFLLVVLYTDLGGYVSTLRTDALQTTFFIGVLCFIVFKYLPTPSGGIGFGFADLAHWKVSASPSTHETLVLAASFAILGAAFIVSAQDVWVRSLAVSKRGTSHANTYIGLCVALVSFVPLFALFAVGAWATTWRSNLSPAEQQGIFGFMIRHLEGQAPVGLLLATLISIAISTADTALITTTQVVTATWKSRITSLRSARVLTAVFGVLGIGTALVFPDVISAFFALSSLPIAFLPLILARMFNRGTSVWVARGVLIGGAAIGLVAGLAGGQWGQAAPILVVVWGGVMFPTGQGLASVFAGRR